MVIVVLVSIPYIILHKSLTADDEETKYDEAHRWGKAGAWKMIKVIVSDLLGLAFLLLGLKTSSPTSRAIH